MKAAIRGDVKPKAHPLLWPQSDLPASANLPRLRFTMKRASIFCLLSFCFSAPVWADAPPCDIKPDVVYGHKMGMALTLDVLKPKSNGNGAGVLFMVSGGWVS